MHIKCINEIIRSKFRSLRFLTNKIIKQKEINMDFERFTEMKKIKHAYTEHNIQGQQQFGDVKYTCN